MTSVQFTPWHYIVWHNSIILMPNTWYRSITNRMCFIAAISTPAFTLLWMFCYTKIFCIITIINRINIGELQRSNITWRKSRIYTWRFNLPSKDGLISIIFSLRLKYPKKSAKSLPWVSFLKVDDARDNELVSFFEDLLLRLSHILVKTYFNFKTFGITSSSAYQIWIGNLKRTFRKMEVCS